jgi:hypothetical protein
MFGVALDRFHTLFRNKSEQTAQPERKAARSELRWQHGSRAIDDLPRTSDTVPVTANDNMLSVCNRGIYSPGDVSAGVVSYNSHGWIETFVVATKTLARPLLTTLPRHVWDVFLVGKAWYG